MQCGFGKSAHMTSQCKMLVVFYDYMSDVHCSCQLPKVSQDKTRKKNATATTDVRQYNAKKRKTEAER